MKTRIVAALDRIGAGAPIRALRASMRARAELPPNSTVLIHIGKCGGRTLRAGLRNGKHHKDVNVVHVQPPVYRGDLRYIIVTRNPISRASSAFRWRYRLVVSTGIQKDRFRGEYEVLKKYGSLNSLAEALYRRNGEPSPLVQAELRKIHHIREDISFYLTALLGRVKPYQILAVLTQEHLDADIARVFGYENSLRKHHNSGNIGANGLSEFALGNLRRFLLRDYAALTTLYCWGKIDRSSYVDLMTREV